jgi:hypothetical protein
MEQQSNSMVVGIQSKSKSATLSQLFRWRYNRKDSDSSFREQILATSIIYSTVPVAVSLPSREMR